MITMKNTENLAGVCISGDFNDLDKLVDAFYAITIDEFSEKNKRYVEISTRVLGVCYDVRHSLQGDREVELVYNGMDADKMKHHSIIAPKTNVYYNCNYLYPEMFFVMIALNELVKLRISDLVKSKHGYNDAFDKNVIWDDKIGIIRCFQSTFMKCVKELLTETSFSRWLKLMNGYYINIEEICYQYVDLQNIKYINMNREKRLKSLATIAKKIAEFRSNEEHNQIEEVVAEAAREYGCDKGDICLKDTEYPNEIVW